MGQEPHQAQRKIGSQKWGSSSYYTLKRRKIYWKKGKGHSLQTTEDLSGTEGQGSETQTKAPHPPPTEGDSTHEVRLTSGRAKYRALKRYQRHKQGTTTPSPWDAPATSRDPTIAEAEGVAAGGSGVGPIILPPPNVHPVDSEPRMPTGHQATRCLEEPSPGPPLLEDVSTSEEELCSREAVRRWKGGRRVQPIFRIIYTALGEPQEGSTHEPLRK